MNNLEFATKMQKRTKAFAVQVVKFFGKLPTDSLIQHSTLSTHVWH